jgi:hypothetical protein
MASAAPVLRRLVHRGRLGLLWCSRKFMSSPGTEVDDG